MELLGSRSLLTSVVVTVASPTDASAQVTIVGNDDPAALRISVEVDDVDAVFGEGDGAGLRDRPSFARRGMENSTLHVREPSETF